MADMKWTDAQAAAIYDRGGTLLVSAAAGSGKTAVLTERVVELLRDADNAISADRLLIVTFTNAAAAELRARIAARLAQVLAAEPTNNHLRRQKMLLQRAAICTIDSFCLHLVQQHFTALDVPPDFTLADTGIAERLRGEALAQTLETAYQNPAFCDFVDLYGKGRSDGAAGAAILQLYEFLRTVPDEDGYLEYICAQWDPAEQQTQDTICMLLQTEIADKAQLGLYFAQEAMQSCLFVKEEAIILARSRKKTPAAQQKAEDKETEKYQKVMDRLQAMVDVFTQLCALVADESPAGWDTLAAFFAPYRDGTLALPSLTGIGVRLSTLNGMRVKQSAARVSDLFVGALALLPCTLAEDSADRAVAHPMVVALCAAQRQFADLYYQKKLEKKVLEFADLEHLTRRLLSCKDGVRTPLAASIATSFDAIMVDEYQDTNQLQDFIYHQLANDAKDNLFYVGDVKQSIYRFRKADPSIFSGKLHIFAPLANGSARPAPPAGQAGENALLALDANFRSTPNVVGGINFIFEQMMTPCLGGVKYGDGQRLVCKSGGNFDGSVSLLLDDEDGQDPDQIADKIAQLIALGAAGDARGMVRDGAGVRPLRYEDCCILLTTRAPFVKYAEALAARGIASYADSAEDILSTSHIAPLVALLQIIDNPAQDLPLAAVMLSPVFSFTEDDLVALRLRCPKGSLYGAVAQVAGDASADAVSRRIADFYETLSALRRLSHTLAPDALLDEMFATTHYLALIGAMENGARRREDIAKFAAYVATAGANGIDSLVRNIEQTKASGGLVDAAPGRAKAGCVTIMTVHRSKGLQFPAVFVADLDHRFNTDDLKRKLQMHPVYGLGMQLRAGAEGGNYHTLLSTALRKVEREELYSEQMRLLYVALTRAQDHLYLCGSAKGYEKKLQTLAHGMEGDLGVLTLRDDCMNSICFMDWVLRALLRHPDGTLLRDAVAGVSLGTDAATSPFSIEVYQPADAADETNGRGQAAPTGALEHATDPVGIDAHIDLQAQPEPDGRAQLASTGELGNTALAGASNPSPAGDTTTLHPAPAGAAPSRTLTAAPDAALVQQLRDGFAWQYPHAALSTLPAKVSVTSLVHKEQGTILARPAFLAKDGMTAAEKGTALHAFLENADFAALKAARAAGKDALRAALLTEQTRQEDEQLMLPELAAQLDMPSVEAFFMGEAFRRIAHATEIHREYAFITGLPAAEVLAATQGQHKTHGRPQVAPTGELEHAVDAVGVDAHIDPSPAGAETAIVLVQGIADLLLVYPDHLELLDYKSDHGKSEEAFRTAYAKQLAYYARAIEKRFAPLKITYKALYSFALGKLIPVTDEDFMIE